MRKLVTLGLVVATVAFAGTAFADGGSMQNRELQELFEWSHKAMDAVKEAAQQRAKTAGPGAQGTKPVPPYQEWDYYPFKIN